jgi:hypothetical protein
MKKFDVYMITYTETNGESNFRHAQRTVYPQIKRIDNIKGRSNAYAKVFEDTDADFVYIVSGDHNINPEFKFKEPTDDAVHIWPSVNRSNQYVSYSSGIKLFPVAQFKNHKFDKVDPLLGFDHKVILETDPASTHQWDYNDFAIFSHVVKENIILRVMIDEGINGAVDEYATWQTWDLHPEYSRENIKVFWEFAETLNPNDVPDELFDDYDHLKKMFVDSFIKTEVNAR